MKKKNEGEGNIGKRGGGGGRETDGFSSSCSEKANTRWSICEFTLN